LFGPIGTTVVNTHRVGGVGYGLYEGNKDGKSYFIWCKPIGESEVVIIKTFLKK